MAFPYHDKLALSLYLSSSRHRAGGASRTSLQYTEAFIDIATGWKERATREWNKRGKSMAGNEGAYGFYYCIFTLSRLLASTLFTSYRTSSYLPSLRTRCVTHTRALIRLREPLCNYLPVHPIGFVTLLSSLFLYREVKHMGQKKKKKNTSLETSY